MSLLIQTEAPPLREDSSGAFRIGQSHVLLELVIRAFQDGATPEAIVQRYPTTTLADIYAVIAYSLNHRESIEEYLKERDRQSEETRLKIKKQQGDLGELRQRLLARQPT